MDSGKVARCSKIAFDNKDSISKVSTTCNAGDRTSSKSVYVCTGIYRDLLKIEKIVFVYTLFQSRVVPEPSSRHPIPDLMAKKIYRIYNAGGMCPLSLLISLRKGKK